MTITIKGLNVHYFSPKEKYSNWKKEFNSLMEECLKFNHPDLENTKQYLKSCTIPRLKECLIEFKNGNFLKFNKTEKLLKEAEEHQKQNGGILHGIEFPFENVIPHMKRGKIIKYESVPPQVKEVYENMVNNFEKGLENAKKETEGKLFYELEGIKESIGKTDYSEINLEILDLMAERFTANKHKYPIGNMKKPLNKTSLVWAAFRHIRKMLQPIKNDPETFKEHLVAVLCNMSMILDQENIKNE